MKNPIRILHLEDDVTDTELVGRELRKQDIHFEKLVVDTRQTFTDALYHFLPDVILADNSLPSFNSFEALQIIRHLNLDIPFILVSATISDDMALNIVKLGADDYILKDRLNRLPSAVLNTIEKYRLERERKRIYREVREKQKKANDAIKISNEKYELIAKATSDMVWDWDLLTNKVYRSKEGWIKIFSDSTYKASGTEDDWDSRIHPDDIEKVRQTKQQIFNTPDQHLFKIECRVLNDKGVYLYIEDKGHIMRNEEGKPIRLIGTSKNITERKQAEEELKTSEERYRYLFDNNAASMVLWDLDSLDILEANDTAAKTYGYSKEEFIKLSVFDLRRNEEYDALNKFIAEVKASPCLKKEQVWKHVNKSGEDIYMNIASHKIFYNGKTVMMSMGNNVTEKMLLQKKLDKELAEKQKEITAAVITAQEKEREQIGGELHDNVNQILASALLYMGVAKRHIENPVVLAETEKLINSAIKEIRILSHSLIPPALEETSLQKALQNIIKIVGNTSAFIIHNKLDCTDENNMPDKLKLSIYRIVQEQLNNIHKYAKAKNVHITLCCDEKTIVLYIKDDGIGFDTTKKYEGVGLMNIKTRASLYNGKVTINSAPGNGCELCIVFEKELLQQ